MNVGTDMGIESLDALQKLIANLPPQIPVSIDVWSTKEIAALLKVSESQVRERIVCKPDFPPPKRIPTDNGRPGRPRWKAREVIAWFERQPE